MKNSLIYSLIIAICLIFIGSSCSFIGGKKRWQPVKPTRHAFVHTVEWPEETIPMISSWYTGKAENAENVVKANPTINSDKLVVGTLIYIPRKLLKTRKTMPRRFVEDTITKKDRKASSAPIKTAPSEKGPESKQEFELFGPR